ncbi:MAG: ligase-associated DNA damage response DEXH box helicase [Luteolibacter sp.]
MECLQPYFDARGWVPFSFQRETWQAFCDGKSGLLHAPTGLGKSLAVYLGPLAEQMREPRKPAGCEVLWITPLRALAADTLRALREPLHALAPGLEAEARTGDTPAGMRARLRKRLPHTFVTTPESLSLMLTHADTREKFAALRCVIVDEWHELLGSKRGVQTELCLARLRAWLPGLRVWGLSATLGNLEEARRVLLGNGGPPSVEISARESKEVRIETLVPDEIDHFPWAGHLGTRLAGRVACEIERSTTTLLFTNTRSQTEIWYQELLELRPQWKGRLAMHHGSLERADREVAEAGLRDGTLKCVVATSSLDLGVDFSPVDQVIQVGSPKGIARLLQRAGRSGHRPGVPSRILCVPTNAFELVEFAAARDAAGECAIESRVPLRKPLDVLVQHLVTCAIGEPFEPDAMRREIETTHAYHDLTDNEWSWALGFITDGGKALSAYPRYRKVRIEGGRLVLDDKALILRHRLGIGTISSDPAVSVRFANGKTLGTIEESFVTRLRPGAKWIFAGRHLQLVRLRDRVATVKPATGKGAGQVAIWSGGKMPLSTELALAVRRRLHGVPDGVLEMDAVAPILDIQRVWSDVPGGDALLVEFTATREGGHLFIYPFAGRLVHEGLAALVAHRLAGDVGEGIVTTQNDYGFSLTARRGLALDESTLRRALAPEHLLDDLLECLNATGLARRQFREIARVSGLVLPQPPGRVAKPQRELQSSANLLYEVLERYDPDNLLIAQSRREILEKQLEFTRLRSALDELASQPMRLIETARLTPMAFPLWADRLNATMVADDATTRLEAMLAELNGARA